MEIAKKHYLAIANDETLAEHDAKYHRGGYREGQDCRKREVMASDDPVDTDISKDAKAVSESEKKASDEAAKRNADLANQWRRYLRGISIEKLSETMHKYDDGNHKPLMKIILEEVDRRDNATIEKRMNDLGERA